MWYVIGFILFCTGAIHSNGGIGPWYWIAIGLGGITLMMARFFDFISDP